MFKWFRCFFFAAALIILIDWYKIYLKVQMKIMLHTGIVLCVCSQWKSVWTAPCSLFSSLIKKNGNKNKKENRALTLAVEQCISNVWQNDTNLTHVHTSNWLNTICSNDNFHFIYRCVPQLISVTLDFHAEWHPATFGSTDLCR